MNGACIWLWGGGGGGGGDNNQQSGISGGGGGSGAFGFKAAWPISAGTVCSIFFISLYLISMRSSQIYNFPHEGLFIPIANLV